MSASGTEAVEGSLQSGFKREREEADNKEALSLGPESDAMREPDQKRHRPSDSNNTSESKSENNSGVSGAGAGAGVQVLESEDSDDAQIDVEFDQTSASASPLVGSGVASPQNQHPFSAPMSPPPSLVGSSSSKKSSKLKEQTLIDAKLATGSFQINYSSLLTFARLNMGYFPLLEALRNVNNLFSSSSSSSSSTSAGLTAEGRWPTVWQRENSAPTILFRDGNKVVSNPSGYKTARTTFPVLPPLSSSSSSSSSPSHWYFEIDILSPCLSSFDDAGSSSTSDQPTNTFPSTSTTSSPSTNGANSTPPHLSTSSSPLPIISSSPSSSGGVGMGVGVGVGGGVPEVGKGAHVRVGWSSATNDPNGPVGYNECGFGWRDNPSTLFFMGRPVVAGSSLASLLRDHRQKVASGTLVSQNESPNASSESISVAKIGSSATPPLPSYASSLPVYGEKWGIGDTIGCLFTLTCPSLPSPLIPPSSASSSSLSSDPAPPTSSSSSSSSSLSSSTSSSTSNAGEEEEVPQVEVMEGSEVRFFKNGKDMGVAFRDIPCVGASRTKPSAREGRGGEWYPSVSLYYGARVRLNPGPLFRFPISVSSSSSSSSSVSSSRHLPEISAKDYQTPSSSNLHNEHEPENGMHSVRPFANPLSDAAPFGVYPDPPPFPPDLFASLLAAARSTPSPSSSS